MAEITDEELSGLKNHYERIMQGWQNPKDFPELLTLVASMLARIESEREKEGAEIGPDYLGRLINFNHGKYSLDLEAVKRNISRYLKGRIDWWDDYYTGRKFKGGMACPHGANEVATIKSVIKEIHEALCGEVEK